MTERLRDAHRSAVYSVEEQWSVLLDRGGSVDFFGSRLSVPRQRVFGDLDAVRTYVDWVMGREPVARQYPDAGPLGVRRRAGQSRAHYEPAARMIAIPIGSPVLARESVVLHEVAHHLACHDPAAAADAPWHGTAFLGAMCRVVREALGEPAELLLRAGYEGAGLRTVAAT